MVKEYFNGLMAQSLLEIGMKINKMDMELII